MVSELQLDRRQGVRLGNPEQPWQPYLVGGPISLVRTGSKLTHRLPHRWLAFGLFENKDEFSVSVWKCPLFPPTEAGDHMYRGLNDGILAAESALEGGPSLYNSTSEQRRAKMSTWLLLCGPVWVRDPEMQCDWLPRSQ